MSELQTVDGGLREPVVVDPRVATVFEMAAYYQAELDRFPAPLQRVKNMLFKLDHAWPYYQNEVQVTGIVNSPVVNVEQPKATDDDGGQELSVGLLVEEGEQENCTYFARNQPYTSFGFDARKEDLFVGGARLGTHYIIQLALQKSASVGLPDGRGTRDVNIPCYADLSSVHLDFSYESPEFTALKACESFPIEFDKIEELVSERQTVAENIIALRKIKVSRNHDTTQEAIQALGQYVEALSQVKKEPSPFVIGTKNLVVFDPDAPYKARQYIKGRGEALVFIDGINLMPKVDVQADPNAAPVVRDDELEFRLIFRNMAPTPKGDILPLEMRLRDIRHIRSVRQQFHEGPPKPR
jgi:hypothetical protein